MKKILLPLIGLLAIAAGCQNERFTDGPAENNADGNVTFTVSAPGNMETRAVYGESSNSARGGLTNVDFASYDLRYQLAIYWIDGAGGTETYTEVIAPQPIIVDSYQPVTYSLRLTPNRDYQVVVWADFVNQGGGNTDLHYDTGDFRNITCLDGMDAQLNDESRDAYFITQKIHVGNNGITQDLILKRPFAKLRMVATDWAYGNLEMPDNFKITYYGCKRFTNIDLLTGLSESTDLDEAATDAYTGTINKAEKEYALNYDESAHNRTVIVDYLMTDFEEQTPIHIKYEAYDGATLVNSHDLKTDIPIQRNWLTTILGNMFTTSADFKISIDENFENEWIVGEEWWRTSEFAPVEPAYDEATNTYYIYTKEEFMWLPDHINEMRSAHGSFTLEIMNDIDMSGVEWKPIYPEASSMTYTVNGNGHTLRNFSMSGKYGAIYEYKVTIFGTSIVLGTYEAYSGVWGKFDGTMNDLTFENITLNGLADDEVHFDTDGNPVDHSNEFAYFAGCIGYTGGNQWSMDSKFNNVHVRHLHIKASANTSQNIGGLVGWVGSGGGGVGSRSISFNGCTAEDIYLTGYQAGGLVGQILGDRGAQFIDCHTDNVFIRYSYISQSSGLIGNIGDGGLTISFYAAIEIDNCSVGHVEYIHDGTGEPYDYEPQHEFYGHKNDGDKVTITPEA